MRWFTVFALAIAIGLAAAVSPFASSSPDGLERVAADKAFIDNGRTHGSPISGYAFPGIDDPRVATGLAGFTGTLLVFGAAIGMAAVARRRTGAA